MPGGDSLLSAIIVLASTPQTVARARAKTNAIQREDRSAVAANAHGAANKSDHALDGPWTVSICWGGARIPYCIDPQNIAAGVGHGFCVRCTRKSRNRRQLLLRLDLQNTLDFRGTSQ